jgi:hypothetical protein
MFFVRYAAVWGEKRKEQRRYKTGQKRRKGGKDRLFWHAHVPRRDLFPPKVGGLGFPFLFLFFFGVE